MTVNKTLADLAGLHVGDHVDYVGPGGVIDQPVTIKFDAPYASIIEDCMADTYVVLTDAVIP